jgi:ubiquinone/menaquinone biosynthesis C-methylase UbiE
MEGTRRIFIPAAGHDWLLPLYDPFVRLLGADRARRVLLDDATLRPGDNVLDLGCGTGTLATLIKCACPGARVFGLDPDAKALAKARRKALRAGVPVQLDQGYADELPYSDQSFDTVFSSFMFHHLDSGAKAGMLREVLRVLKPGGSIYLLDFGGPQPGPGGLLAHVFHARDRLRDNFEGRIPGLLRQAGFSGAREIRRGAVLFGKIAYYTASAPVCAGSQ